jgi:hypothetical protein
VGSAQGAMVDRAAEIGAKDAEIYSAARLANQKARNDAGQFNADSTNKFGAMAFQQEFDAGQSELERALKESLLASELGSREKISANEIEAANSRLASELSSRESIAAADRASSAAQNAARIAGSASENAARIAGSAAENDARIAASAAENEAKIAASETELQMKIDAEKELAALKTSNESLVAGNSAAATLIRDSNDQINTILANPDIAPDAKTDMVNNVLVNTQQSVDRMALVYDVDFSDLNWPAPAESGTDTSTNTNTSTNTSTNTTTNAATNGGYIEDAGQFA